MRTKISLNPFQRTEDKKDPKLLWKRLQDHVLRGQARNFLTDFTSTQRQYESRKRGKLLLPKDFLIDDEDTAADKFTKLVAHQIHKLRQDSTFLKQGVDDSHVQVNYEKDKEAYDELLPCLIYPLLDHQDLVQSNEDLSKDDENPSPNLSKAIFGMVYKKKTNSDIFGISHSVFKDLKIKIRDYLKREEKNCKHDIVYYNALIKFYSEIYKKRPSQVLAAGSSFEDLLRVFSINVYKEMEDDKIDDSLQDDLKSSECLNAAAASRIQTFTELVKSSIEDVSVSEIRQKQQKVSKDYHKRQGSNNNDSAHRRNISVISDVGSISNHQQNQPHLMPETLALTEWLKSAFSIRRAAHEQCVNKINENHVKAVIIDFEARLKQIEADTANEIYEPPLSITYGINEKSFSINKDVYAHWRKTEKQQLTKLTSRANRLYLEPPESEKSEEKIKSDEEEKKKEPKLVKIRVRVVEARGLLGKDDDGNSDPYVVVEHGSDQRYETEVVSDTLMPLWDQEITLEVKNVTTKPVSITVWDKDDDDKVTKNIFSQKFWKEEADDFLGMVTFDVPSLLEELESLPTQRFDKWFPLQKRSKRSHVAGDIRLAVEVSTDEPKSIVIPEIKEDKLVNDETVNKLSHCSSIQELYTYLCSKLLDLDFKRGLGEFGDGSLSKASEAILDEIGERYRLSIAWREIAYLEVLAKRYMEPPMSKDNVSIVLSAKTLSLIYTRIDQLVLQATHDMMGIKVLVPLKVDYSPDGTKLVNPPIVSGTGDVILTDEMLSKYNSILSDIYKFQQYQIQKYKDFFPCDTPSGSLVSTLTMLQMLHENELINPNQKKQFSELLEELVKTGTIERFMKLSELSSPVKRDEGSHLVQMADLIIEEIESDETYFRKPFAADLDVVTTTSQIYIKYFVLELEDLITTLNPVMCGKAGKAPKEISSHIFDLYYRSREIQEKYVSDDLKKEYNVYKFFSPCIHAWLSSNESKLIEWVNGALKADIFNHLDKGSSIMHSTSVIDLFFCFKQMLECLHKLEWINFSEEDDEDERDMRMYHWSLFITRYSRIIGKALSEYCSQLFKQVMDEQIRYKKDAEKMKGNSTITNGKSSLDSALGSLTIEKVKQDGSQIVSGGNWISDTTDTIGICVRINNLEAARLQLNDLYDELKVDEIQQMLEKKKKKTLSNPESDEAVINGYLTLKVLLAENLMACDSNGKSDAYCIINVKERKDSQDVAKLGSTSMSSVAWTGSNNSVSDAEYRYVGKTKTIIGCLNPRWNETFTCVLRKAEEIQLVVNDYDMIGKDDLCGKAAVNLADLKDILKDEQTHEIWVDLRPQGRILIRVQVDNKQMKPNQLADIDFYFRKTLRELKRFSSDLLDIMAQSMAEALTDDFTRIVKECGKKETFFHQIFGGNNSENDTDGLDVVNMQTLDRMMDETTSYLNDALSVISQHLYGRLSKELMKKIWKEVLDGVLSMMLPSLYGEIMLSGVNKTKPLDKRQMTVLIQCVDILKEFLYADGNDAGLSQASLENAKYQDLKRANEIYFKDRRDLLTDINIKKVSGEGVDLELRLLRFRSQTGAEKAELKKEIEEREKSLKFMNKIQELAAVIALLDNNPSLNSVEKEVKLKLELARKNVETGNVPIAKRILMEIVDKYEKKMEIQSIFDLLIEISTDNQQETKYLKSRQLKNKSKQVAC